MKRVWSGFLIFILLTTLFLHTNPVSADDSAVSLSLSLKGTPYKGGTVTAVISVSTPSVLLAGLEFSLRYDPEQLSPIIVENSPENPLMDAFAVILPDGWEQMHRLDTDESKYELRFAMTDEADALSDGSQILLEIPFEVLKSGDLWLEIADSDIIAVANDAFLSIYGGNGCRLDDVSLEGPEMLSVDMQGTMNDDGLYTLSIDVTNIADRAGIIAFQLALKYDSSVFTPTITQNDECQMDAFMVKAPGGAWEQMCTHYDDARYVLRFAALHAEDPLTAELLTVGDSVTLSIPFTHTGNVDAEAVFSVSDASVIGLNNANDIIAGKGDSVTAKLQADSSLTDKGFEIYDGCLLFVKAETSVADLLKELSGSEVYSDGKKVNSGLVCTDYTLKTKNESLQIVVRGDTDGNGSVDVMDYLLVKRSFFKTYSPSKAQIYAMTLTQKGVLTAYDYLYLKRHVFGSLDINTLVAE